MSPTTAKRKGNGRQGTPAAGPAAEDPLGDRIGGIRMRLNRRLEEFHRAGDYHRGMKDFIDEAHALLMSREAKRVRGVLPVLLAEDQGLEVDDSLTYGVIVELLHFTSLVHDDVIDQHRTRRGLLTLNHRFSDNRAVLTGDYLIYEVIGRCLSLAHNLRIIDLVVDTAREMVAGVLMEQSVLAAEPTLGEYLAMARSKTGSLFGLAFGLPFVVDPRLEDARECGAIFGTVFQIHDDRLDRDQDLSHENIFHICSPAEIEGILADQTGRLFAAGRKIGIESTLLDVIAYLKTYGYFPEVGKGRPRGRRLPRSSGA